MLGVAGVGENRGQVRVSGRAAAVFWRAGARAATAGEAFVVGGADALDGHVVLPAVTEVVAVQEAIADAGDGAQRRGKLVDHEGLTLVVAAAEADLANQKL